jgi:Tfp pilus assembly protein FimT
MHLSTHQKSSGGPGQRQGFTLTELLVVVSIIILMMTMAIPAFNAIRGGSDFSSVVYDMQGILDSSRAYAMSHNTYVLVGIMEVTESQSTNTSPMVAGIGRIAIAAVASNDGTRPYQYALDQAHASGNPISQNVLGSGSEFTAITKLITFDNMHIVDLQGGTASVPTQGNMVRPNVTTYFDVGNTTNCISATPLGWPLGTSVSGSATPQYSFATASATGGNVANVVIEFDPSGSARIITNQGGPLLDAIPQQIEIGLEPARGTTAAPITSEVSGQVAALQIDGMSGAIRIYRP